MDFDIKDMEPLWGKWTVGKKLGEGAFGKTWEIHSDREVCALKQIDILYSDIDEKRAFIEGITKAGIRYYYKALLEDSLDEIKIMQGLKKCENIVALEEYDVIEEDNCGWHILMRMELLQPLSKYLYENEFNIKAVVKLGTDICKALEECRKCNIIHRDIKPDNIFYDKSNDTFKLGDFGIAIDLKTPTMVNGRPGTITHMSPEVYRGEEYTFDDDVYALGIILYRLLNFNRLPLMSIYPEPFTPKQRNEAVYNRLRGEKLPLPALCNNSDITYKLCETVRRAVSEDKSERYISAYEFRKQLELIINML